jgi:hypothetical protein
MEAAPFPPAAMRFASNRRHPRRPSNLHSQNAAVVTHSPALDALDRGCIPVNARCVAAGDLLDERASVTLAE